MTTRRYPRTTLEAFGCKADTACALERPEPWEEKAGLVLAIGLGIAIAAGLFFGLSA